MPDENGDARAAEVQPGGALPPPPPIPAAEDPAAPAQVPVSPAPVPEWTVVSELDAELLNGDNTHEYADHGDLESALIAFFTTLAAERKFLQWQAFRGQAPLNPSRGRIATVTKQGRQMSFAMNLNACIGLQRSPRERRGA